MGKREVHENELEGKIREIVREEIQKNEWENVDEDGSIPEKVDRRKFLKLAGLGAGALGLTSATSALTFSPLGGGGGASKQKLSEVLTQGNDVSGQNITDGDTVLWDSSNSHVPKDALDLTLNLIVNYTKNEYANNIESDIGAIIDRPLLLGAMVSSKPAMDMAASSSTAMSTIVSDQNAMDTIVESSIAVSSIVNSGTANSAVRGSSAAMDAVGTSKIASGKFVADDAGLDVGQYDDMDELTSSSIAMNAIASSQAALDTLTTLQAAVDSVVNSQTAINALQGVWGTEISTGGDVNFTKPVTHEFTSSGSYTFQNNSSTMLHISYVIDGAGGGGGGGADGGNSSASGDYGDEGESTTAFGVTADGGEGGDPGSQSGSDGSSPIYQSGSNGGAGGSGVADGGDGGDGGNGERVTGTTTLSSGGQTSIDIGAGGAGGAGGDSGNDGSSGEDGYVKISVIGPEEYSV